MDFTRQPIIETVISPRDGHKLLIRNSKEASQDEYLVNAVEIVSFGPALFFRCLEKKPKAFLLPIADYDIVEVKEARLLLKNISTDKPIKIGEGSKSSKEAAKNSKEDAKPTDPEGKKSTKKRNSRKRRSAKTASDKPGSEEEQSEEKSSTEVVSSDQESTEQKAKPPEKKSHRRSKERAKPTKEKAAGQEDAAVPVVSVIFPRPPKIIGKTVQKEESIEPKAKEVFPEAVKESKDETKVATSKDLPPLEEVKETKDARKAAESTKKET